MTPREYKVRPVKGETAVRVDPAYGPVITISGQLFFRGARAGHVHHTLWPNLRLVYLDLMVVEREMRGTGLAVFLLLKNFGYYDSQGIRHVVLQADLSAGKFYWARCGFRFLDAAHLNRVDQWFQLLIGLLGLPLNTAGLTTPAQYALLGKVGGATLSLQQIAAAVPNNPWVNPSYQVVAAENEIAMTDPIDAGKALMITGPAWMGVMDLRGPDRAVVFSSFVQSRLQMIARHV